MSTTFPPQRSIGFLLLPGFALMSYASMVEPLRAANLLSERALYRWLHVSIDGGAVAASTGTAFGADLAVGQAADFDTLIVCAGGDRIDFAQGQTLAWLRRLAREGVRIGGISGGPMVLARAGLLDGYRCTVHWEHAPAFAEEFPHLRQSGRLYEIDRGRLTCAGGIAALDMAREMIEVDHGARLANAVSDWFLQNQIRHGDGAQRMPAGERLGFADRRLAKVHDAMERHIEEPLAREALATLAGLSVRQLERLFAQELGRGVAESYLALRLGRARSLLRQTDLAVSEIAVATGFAAASHFSRAYREQFGLPPARDRLQIARSTR